MFANMNDLRILRLDFNAFTGAIPESVGELKNVRVFKLNNNFNTQTGQGGIEGPIPASIGGMDSVQILEVYSNRIGGAIPVEMGNLESLIYLDLQQNELTGLIPDSFANLINLETFYVSNNNLSGPFPEGLCLVETVQIMVPDCALECPEECCSACV